MRKIFFLFSQITLVLFSGNMNAQNIGIGTNTPHASARLDVTSTNSGLLFPRLTGAQRDAIPNPAAGLAIFCTNCGERGEMQYYDGIGWRSMDKGVAINPVTLVSSLNCGSASNFGDILSGVAPTGVNSIIPYTGGNGLGYPSQSINSTGVTGLTATLAAGTLANGSGSLNYIISGLAATSGTASFLLSVGGQTCTLNRSVSFAPVFNPEVKYADPISDVEGNIYKTVQIGSQIWMAENLRTTKLNDNSIIGPITSAQTWQNVEFPSTPNEFPFMCWYNNDKNASIANQRGALYNHYAVRTGNLCPVGWHVPSLSEWNILIDLLLGESLAGGMMKSIGNQFWASPNVDATNSTGFSGLPAGIRNENGNFSLANLYSKFWSTDTDGFTIGFTKVLDYSNGGLYQSYGRYESGYSVRCVKD